MLIEIVVVSILFFFVLRGVIAAKTMFLLAMALAALEAGLGFSLLVKLLRLYRSPSGKHLINL